MRLWVLASIAAAVTALAVLGTVLLLPGRDPDLPVQTTLPDIQLVDHTDQPFSLAQARGKVVVLGLVYTHCPDICPLIIYRMQSIKDQLARQGLDSDVLFLTVTFDPERDTPGALRAYIAAHNLHTRNWRFLTGNPETIASLTELLGFYTERVSPVGQSAGAATGGSALDIPYFITHADRFYLVDKLGRVRASLPGSRTDVEQAVRLIRRLTQEAP